MNHGETKSNLFTITSNGATSLSTNVSLSPSIPGLNYSPGSAGLTTGMVRSFSLTVPPSAPTGFYSGNIQFTFQPNNEIKTVSINLTVTDPPDSAMGFTFTSDNIDVTTQNDGSKKSTFSFTSTGSTSFSFSINFNNPKPAGGGISYLASGGIVAGQTTQNFIQVYQNVLPGIYTGTGLFRDSSTGAEKQFPVSIVVTS